MLPVRAAALPSFARVADVDPIARSGEHGGRGPIEFRRLLTEADFAAPVDFVDLTHVAPGSTIGAHRHDESEEIYVVLAGTPLVEVDGVQQRLRPGDVAVVHAGGRHALANDTDGVVTIAVVQLRLRA
jgi:uncharacterized RmlC-like cupin family protein